MASESQSAPDLNSLKVELIHANLEAAIASGKLALQSDNEEEITRHKQKACQAHDEALHSMRTTILTPIEWESIRTKLAHFESVLMELGESM